MEKTLKQKIVERYIQPTNRKPSKLVGIEIEMPIVNLTGEAVKFEVVHALTENFIEKFNFRKVSRDDNGDIYQAISETTADGISYDCSYNTLELSFGPEENISIVESRFYEYVSYIQDYLKNENHIVTGMGINPNYQVNKSEPIPNERYRMLFHHLSSYEKYRNQKRFHAYPNFGFFSCASQVQLDISEEQIPQVINVFSKLEPLKAILFANSLWQEEELLCSRDMFWRDSLHGLNLHNVDMFEQEFHTENDVVEYIMSMSIYCVMREEKYINFSPISLKHYFQKEKIEGECYDGKQYQKIVFEPEWEDLSYLRSFKFEDLTYRGTIEFRSSCTQPLSETMTVAAFHAGLLEKVDELDRLLSEDEVIYGHGYSATELRKIFCKNNFPEFVNQEQLEELLFRVINLAQMGLMERKMGEEKYLEPLYERVKCHRNPSLQIVEGLKSGFTMEHFIREYAKL